MYLYIIVQCTKLDVHLKGIKWKKQWHKPQRINTTTLLLDNLHIFLQYFNFTYVFLCLFKSFFSDFTEQKVPVTVLRSTSSSLWNKQYKSILLINRDSLIPPNTVPRELFHNSVFTDVSPQKGFSGFLLVLKDSRLAGYRNLKQNFFKYF